MAQTVSSPSPRDQRASKGSKERLQTSLYDRDFVEWTAEQARLIRSGDLGALDLDNLAEEVDCMGGSQRSEIANRLVVILDHLLKWEYQLEKRKYGWRATLSEQRGAVYFLVEASPSLKAQPALALQRAYKIGRMRAAGDTGLPERHFPAECPYSVEQVLDTGFLPGPEENDVV